MTTCETSNPDPPPTGGTSGDARAAEGTTVMRVQAARSQERARRQQAHAPVRDEGRRWGSDTVAGRPVRFWADLAAGRVVVCTDEPEPREVGLALDIDADDRRGWILINTQQTHWATPAREELLRAAISHYNRAQADTNESGGGGGSGECPPTPTPCDPAR